MFYGSYRTKYVETISTKKQINADLDLDNMYYVHRSETEINQKEYKRPFIDYVKIYYRPSQCIIVQYSL